MIGCNLIAEPVAGVQVTEGELRQNYGTMLRRA